MNASELQKIQELIQDSMRRVHVEEEQREKFMELKRIGACEHELEYIRSKKEDITNQF